MIINSSLKKIGDKELIILFDLDGTLIDSTFAITDTFLYVFAKHSYPFTKTVEDIKKQIGYPLDIMFENLGIPRAIVWDFVDSYKMRYKNISVAQTSLLENAFEAVKLASSFATLGVVTTKTRIYSTPILDNFDIGNDFRTIIGREDVENPKPHQEPILKALENLNYDKEKHIAYMIGDTKLDMIAAKNASINSIGVLCGYSSFDELKNYTDIVKDNSFEAIKYLENLFS
ncbi:HAD family hydrolase [Aliarcobacter trophiarum]|uniref:phosphoglycolate phosphatase n=1 Tax=Aliarcobacter trophiarum LMG 25534 TaxID=1032241 RepID=A0AAD0QIZ8_9BACT|nr:HAD family hydrolase [Aliarcobacter trophiarum]AXK47990.1 HAD superfamily hydrolase, probable phosphatase [Aliarcobacter trophiarum LMG 25534]